MRLFLNLEEAASEIRRDLAKSPLVKTNRVQGFSTHGELHEALDYSYSVFNFPTSMEELLSLGEHLGMYDPAHRDAYRDWFCDERSSRLSWKPGETTEILHPHLSKLLFRNSTPGYTYTDRLALAVECMTATLQNDSSSRRAFWPIFEKEDALRAVRPTRIPCSLGYQLMIREVDNLPFVHLTYLQRACDFDKFWLSDLWLARQFQHAVCDNLNGGGDPEFFLGNLTHFVTSMHSFISGEVY